VPIDWFTVAAQAVNFLILVALLRHFLYGPVTRAVERRREDVAARRREAEDLLEQARDRERRLEEERRQLDEQRRDRLDAARAEAERLEQRLIDEAREEVDRRRRGWERELARRRERLVDELGRLAARGVAGASRNALAELAALPDDEVHARALDAFVRRLGSLDDEQVAALRGGVDGPVRLSLARAPDAEGERRLRRAVAELVGGDARVELVPDEDLGLGVELTAGGRRVAWSARAFVEDLGRELLAQLEQASREGAGAGEEDAPPAEEPGDER